MIGPRPRLSRVFHNSYPRFRQGKRRLGVRHLRVYLEVYFHWQRDTRFARTNDVSFVDPQFFLVTNFNLSSGLLLGYFCTIVGPGYEIALSASDIYFAFSERLSISQSYDRDTSVIVTLAAECPVSDAE